MSSTDDDDFFEAVPQADSGLYGSNRSYYQMLLENNYVSDLSKVFNIRNIIIGAIGCACAVWQYNFNMHHLCDNTTVKFVKSLVIFIGRSLCRVGNSATADLYFAISTHSPVIYYFFCIFYLIF